jgi:glycosyltransferase involved in cell wall biosynthesis
VKVLLVADFYPPAPGGLEAHVRRLALALHRAGDRVVVVAGGGSPRRAGEPSDEDGILVHRLGVSVARVPGIYRTPARAFHPPWADRDFQRGLGEILRGLDPDVVHAHGWCGFSAAASCAGRWPLVVTLHDYGLRCPKKNLLRGDRECLSGRGVRCANCAGREQGPAKRCVLGGALACTAPRLPGRVARFIAVSRHVALRHLEEPAFRRVGVEVIPNFLDVPAEPFAPPTGSEVLFVGPADRHKGLQVLLQAWRSVPSGFARLTVVGATAAQVNATAADGVDFTGRLDGAAVWRRLRAAALVVAPAIWPEPCPTVVLEALAAGRPVVASGVGGHPDLIVDGRTGRLVPPGDARALAVAIVDLLADRPRLREMARAARVSAHQFDTPSVVSRIQTVYADVLANRSVR